MEYTEQDIEMLARFDMDRFGAPPWDMASDGARAGARDFIKDRLGADPPSLHWAAAFRLMREAREQGLATARDEIRKAGEREQATWDQLVRDVKEARERGAKEMRDKALTVARKIATLALASVKKRDAAKTYALADAHDEGAYVQAETLVLALEELSPSEGPSEYELGAAEMRERAADLARDNKGDTLGVDAMIRALPITVPS